MIKKIADFDWHRGKNGYVFNDTGNADKIKGLLNSTGCGFCLAKFRQVTLHLGTGMTHSCHHPSPHKIPLDELQDNPAALFNTQHLKQARKQMLNNERPAECDYCWRVEDDGGTSDRTYKSLESWALPDHDKIAQLKGDEDIYPSYLEVSFSNVCNMKCTYCGPEFSSKWVEELKKDGPVKLLEGTKHEQWSHGYQDLDALNIKNRDYNPYVDAFWKWFPDALPHLKHYRITGGEPLMSKETFKSMDWLIDNPNRDMEFSINSNFSVPDKLWDKFIDKLVLLKQDKVKKITIYTSIEGWGERAEYARTGLDFELLLKRYEQILQLGNVRCVIMAAYNIFSITSMTQMLEWLHTMKIRYNPNDSAVKWENDTGYQIQPRKNGFQERQAANPDHNAIVGVDIPYLRHPTFLDAQLATDELVNDYMLPTMNYLAEHVTFNQWNSHQGFEDFEVEKYKRIVMHRMYYNREGKQDKEVEVQRAKFYEFVNNMDKRRGTDFLSVFPEMKEFYDLCEACFKRVLP